MAGTSVADVAIAWFSPRRWKEAKDAKKIASARVS
jgi:hypothetical protein